MVISIDPDVKLSGVAVMENGELSLYSLAFFNLLDFLSERRSGIEMIYIEAGWMNKKSNFRTIKGNDVNARIGAKVGANHEIGKKIAEMATYLKVPFTEVGPLRKVWKGVGGKITHDEFNKIAKTNFKTTNQETRDAGLILITR